MLLFGLLGLGNVAAIDKCCFPQQYSYRVFGSSFAGDVGMGETVSQFVGRTDTFVAWKFQMAGIQANTSIGWVGYVDGGSGSVSSGYEFEASGSGGFCCKAGKGGHLEWVVPPRCTDEFGLARSGNVTIGGIQMTVWSKWVDPLLLRRWNLVTTADCVPVFSTGSDARSFASSYYDNTGYTAADWDTSANVKNMGTLPPICDKAPLCVDPNWKPPPAEQLKQQKKKEEGVKQEASERQKRSERKFSGPNLGIHPNDLFFRPETLPLPREDITVSLPDSFDWDLDKKKVTPATNQNALTCGSCWAHASTGAVESARAIFGDGQLLPLSVQQLIDCERNTYSQGCGGGATFEALDYAASVGLELASSYPLSSINAACDFNPQLPKVKIGNWSGAQFTGNEDAMRTALYQYGPLTAGVSTMGWGLYSGGVLTSCGTSLSHVVLVVGWGVDQGLPYWRVKNSFGTSWGENGYIRLLRGQNMCGIATAGFWVLYNSSSSSPSSSSSTTH